MQARSLLTVAIWEALATESRGRPLVRLGNSMFQTCPRRITAGPAPTPVRPPSFGVGTLLPRDHHRVAVSVKWWKISEGIIQHS